MEKHFSTLVGITLILLGGLALMFNLVGPALGVDIRDWGVWRFWPLIVVSVGWLLVLLPLLVRGWRGVGGLFIPGMPILITGSIFLVASVLNWWSIWQWLWPLEVLSLALGFLFAAIYMRLVWLVIPAIIIGLNGLVLQFCALTGLWELWSVLWTVEPLAVGASLLAVSFKNRSVGLFVAGLILCGLAGAGLLMMTGILAASVLWSGVWLVNVLGPIILILVGVLLIIWNALRRPAASSLY
jgi:hypothetical protein